MLQRGKGRWLQRNSIHDDRGHTVPIVVCAEPSGSQGVPKIWMPERWPVCYLPGINIVAVLPVGVPLLPHPADFPWGQALVSRVEIMALSVELLVLQMQRTTVGILTAARCRGVTLQTLTRRGTTATRARATSGVRQSQHELCAIVLRTKITSTSAHTRRFCWGTLGRGSSGIGFPLCGG